MILVLLSRAALPVGPSAYMLFEENVATLPILKFSPPHPNSYVTKIHVVVII